MTNQQKEVGKNHPPLQGWEEEYKERFGEGKYYEPIKSFITKTLAEEREKCARVAREWIDKYMDGTVNNESLDSLEAKIESLK